MPTAPMQTKNEPLLPGLYIVATPIGNLEDMTLRALRVLEQASYILCEDSRVTGKLLHHFGLKTKMVTYHEHNAEKRRPSVIADIESGEAIALVSDAGTPLISDPGYKLVRDLRTQNLPITSIPGACAPIVALTLSGIATDQFHFAGFLPSTHKKRRSTLQTLATIPASLIFLESPRRLQVALSDIHDILGNRQVAICRELTKLFEEIRCGFAHELAEYYASKSAPKGEVVIVISPPELSSEQWSESEIISALQERLGDEPVKVVSEEISTLSGWSKKDVYTLAIKVKENSTTTD